MGLQAAKYVSLMRGGLCFLCLAPCLMDRGGLCEGCANDLPLNHPACPACARPAHSPHLCAACLRRPSPHIRHTFALYQYRYPVNRLIQEMKYRSRLEIAQLLGCQLARALGQAGSPLPQAILPVPLHRARLQGRGYNQSLEFARPLAKTLGIPLDITTCLRTGKTLPQAELPAGKRKGNVRGAFTVVGEPSYRHVAIIDDVITTGSTVNELARALVRAGIERIDVWACARAAL